MRVAGFLGMFAIFLALYAGLRRRAASRTGVNPPVQWGWLAAIAVCALIAIAIGEATR